MIKVLMNSLREFKRPTLLTPVFVVGEVVMESLMPFIVAGLLNTLQTGSDVQTLIKQGLILLAMAFAALLCGAAAGLAVASAFILAGAGSSLVSLVCVPVFTVQTALEIAAVYNIFTRRGIKSLAGDDKCSFRKKTNSR